jgi:hypothetical protein
MSNAADHLDGVIQWVLETGQTKSPIAILCQYCGVPTGAFVRAEFSECVRARPYTAGLQLTCPTCLESRVQVSDAAHKRLQQWVYTPGQLQHEFLAWLTQQVRSGALPGPGGFRFIRSNGEQVEITLLEESYPPCEGDINGDPKGLHHPK